MFVTLLAERREQTAKEHLVVTDVCCSYGVNAAMMNHDLGLDDLFEHYGDPDLDGCSREEILEADARFFAERRRSTPTAMVGIDIAANAVSYGVEAGLIDHGVVTNLEDEAPSAAARDAIAETDLVTVTGGVGYVTEKTFDRVIGAIDTADTVDTKPWVAAFALRWVDYEPVADVLAAAGLETEHVDHRVFRQRRFRDDAEREYTLRELRERGIDPSGVEDAGWFYANLFVSRPPEHVRARPASELLADTR